MKLDITNAKLDEVTGFLDFGDAFSIQNKARFLRVYEKTCDKVEAMDSIGFSAKTLEAHLALDKGFKAAFDNVEAVQLAKVEAVLYQRSLQDTGDAARAKWLAARAPEKYGPKMEKEGDRKPSKLDDLLKKMVKEGNGK